MSVFPITRIEKFLDGIINNNSVPTPTTRIEVMLNSIKNGETITITPITRIECYLAKISGASVTIPTPHTRIEMFLAKKAGADVTLPTPITRIEHYLNEWCGGSTPTYETVIGKIVSFLTQRIAPLKIEAPLSPKQDLHGYDNPWPAGGGANIFDGEIENGDINVVNGSKRDSSTRERSKNFIPVTPGNQYYAVSATYTNFVICLYDENKVYIGSGTNYIVVADTNPLTIPAGCYYILFYRNINDNKNIAINYPSSVTTYAPYSNICPITGHTGAVVNRTGKNLLNPNDTENGYIDASGEFVSYVGWKATDFIMAKPDTSYYFSTDSSTGASAKHCVYDAQKHFITGQAYMSGNIQINVPQNGQYIRCSYRDTAEYAQLEEGTSASAYEPFGSSVTISFGQTVYGGKLTVNEDGSGTVVAELASIDCGTLNWNYSGDDYNHRFSANMPSNYKIPTSSSDRANLLCSSYASNPSVVANNSALGISGFQNVSGVYIRDLAYSDKETFQTAMSGVQLVYKLATPVTIALTPGQVEALQGNNTVWVDDSGEIKVTFRSN